MRLFGTPWTVAYQAPPSLGFSRQEYWSGVPFPTPGDLPNPGIEPTSPVLSAEFFTPASPGKPSSDGEGNGTPLQYSCLENPTDGGAWRAAVHGVARSRHDCATSLSLFTFMHWRGKWQPTSVFLPGESQGWGSLVGCHLWGRTESNTTEVT